MFGANPVELRVELRRSYTGQMNWSHSGGWAAEDAGGGGGDWRQGADGSGGGSGDWRRQGAGGGGGSGGSGGEGRREGGGDGDLLHKPNCKFSHHFLEWLCSEEIF